MEDRFLNQLKFVEELDRLKTVLRQTYILDKSRQENSAEHSWHVALLALSFIEYLSEPVDLLKMLKMILIHDVVEIDAGDTFSYDQTQLKSQAERENFAAKRIFSILPQNQSEEFLNLWKELETEKTPEALAVKAFDRYQPVLHNFRTQGASWKKHQVRKSQVLKRNEFLKTTAPKLWQHLSEMIEESVAKGHLLPD